ncbi:class I SAM-dependent methyltransferase [Streptomyces alanosinicus]|uniref:Class I SAM-dependent methyltransferase n=1 Tax=Streptomyces alanosinicus TaxID=68171 RepID=A0A918YJY2_9ACTN|nr:class I SAM-dependent methyltransferase [Streptomyces alanosinicus]GHE05689.1 hypothetical protein GCM10010339_42630 [Streptomyces alanosinicus]
MSTPKSTTNGIASIPVQSGPGGAEPARRAEGEGQSVRRTESEVERVAEAGRGEARPPAAAVRDEELATVREEAPGARERGAEAAAGPDGAGDGGGAADDAVRGGHSPVVAGAGPVGRSGERATLRLRDGEPEEPPRYAPEWLRLRETADAAARAQDLLDPLRDRLAGLPGRTGPLAVHDLGCGTGSMGRWLAPRLAGTQHWVLHDRDPYLLHFAAVGSPRAAADGSAVTVETRRGDLARLTAEALAGAALVTASALLDVLTREEVVALADACAGAGCPALLTLSVAGRVELTPGDPLDGEIAEAFNAHQRRSGLLGPDAVTVAGEAFAARGAAVRVHPSPWRLGPAEAALTEQWLRGWVGAAVEQRPELRDRAERYLKDRLAACAAGELRVVVNHSDLLALPQPTGGVS